MGSRLTIRVPDDYDLPRDLCSYGYFLLAPNRWDPGKGVFRRVLNLSDGAAELAIKQPAGRGTALRATADRALSRADQTEARRMLTRALRLDDDGIALFHKLDPRWKRSGRGRLFRSPTFFEDVIKTVTSCNVTWPGTITMNRRLCEVISPGFPSPAQLSRRRPATLRARCRVGYRDKRMVELARIFNAKSFDAGWYEDECNTDEEVFDALTDLPGIGPYAAANILQLIGRYTRLPIDSESVRHGRDILGFKGSATQIGNRVRKHYAPFADQRFRSYWFDLMVFYEQRKGKAHTWGDGVASSFTAAQFG